MNRWFSKDDIQEGWGHDSVVESAGCSLSGPVFSFQCTHGGSQLSSPQESNAFIWLPLSQYTLHTRCTDTHSGRPTHTHKITTNKNLKKWKLKLYWDPILPLLEQQLCRKTSNNKCWREHGQKWSRVPVKVESSPATLEIDMEVSQKTNSRASIRPSHSTPGYPCTGLQDDRPITEMTAHQYLG